MPWIRAAIAALCLLFVGCNARGLVDRFEPHPASDVARSFIDTLRQQDFDKAKAGMAPALLGYAKLDATMRQIADVLAAKPIRSVKMVGVQSSWEGAETIYNLVYEYEFDPGWALVVVHLRAQGEHVLVDGFHLQPLERSLEDANAFTFAHAGAKHLLMVFLMVLSMATSLRAFVLCLRSPIRRRWLWALISLAGLITLKFDWINGNFDFQLLSVQLPVISWFQQPYGPAIFGVSLPLGALWFLSRRDALIADAALTRRIDAKDESLQAKVS